MAVIYFFHAPLVGPELECLKLLAIKFYFQVSWSNNMISTMNSGELAKDVPEAEVLLQLHHERKVIAIYESPIFRRLPFPMN